MRKIFFLLLLLSGLIYADSYCDQSSLMYDFTIQPDSLQVGGSDSSLAGYDGVRPNGAIKIYYTGHQHNYSYFLLDYPWSASVAGMMQQYVLAKKPFRIWFCWDYAGYSIIDRVAFLP